MRIFGITILPTSQIQTEIEMRFEKYARPMIDKAFEEARSSYEQCAIMRRKKKAAEEELMQLRKAETVPTEDIREQLIRGDNIQATEMKFRQVKELNQELRRIMGQCIRTVESVANKRPNQVTAEHLEDLKYEVNKMREHSSLPSGHMRRGRR